MEKQEKLNEQRKMPSSSEANEEAHADSQEAKGICRPDHEISINSRKTMWIWLHSGNGKKNART